jgi:hypothetical protein
MAVDALFLVLSLNQPTRSGKAAFPIISTRPNPSEHYFALRLGGRDNPDGLSAATSV